MDPSGERKKINTTDFAENFLRFRSIHHTFVKSEIGLSSLLAEVSHDEANWNDRRETSAGFRRVVWWSRRPDFWSKLTSFQNRFCLMCNARALSDCTLIIIEPTVDDPRVLKGAYQLAKKIRKFQLKVKWNSNFPGNPFRNCRLPAQVERNGGNFYHLLNRFQFSVSRSLLSAVNNYGKSNCKW